jgi:hypothetical protein
MITDLSLCDRLLMQAERGEITPAQAEATAAAHGLKPFARKPELSRFDPKQKPYWLIVMAVAWIAWRDFELVMEQDLEFCSKTTEWRYRQWYDREHQAMRSGWLLEPRSPPTVGRLRRIEGAARIRGAPSTAIMTVREAVSDLWRKLSEDLLRGQGINAEGAIIEFLSREWAYLRLCEEGAPCRDVLRYEKEVVSRLEPFTAVKFPQSNLLTLWPAAAEVPALAMPASAESIAEAKPAAKRGDAEPSTSAALPAPAPPTEAVPALPTEPKEAAPASKPEAGAVKAGRRKVRIKPEDRDKAVKAMITRIDTGTCSAGEAAQKLASQFGYANPEALGRLYRKYHQPVREQMAKDKPMSASAKPRR